MPGYADIWYRLQNRSFVRTWFFEILACLSLILKREYQGVCNFIFPFREWNTIHSVLFLGMQMYKVWHAAADVGRKRCENEIRLHENTSLMLQFCFVSRWIYWKVFCYKTIKVNENLAEQIVFSSNRGTIGSKCRFHFQ